MAYVVSNLRGDWHRHLVMTMTSTEYMEQSGFTFVPTHNPGKYSQSVGSAQEQALGTEKFWKNQAVFRKYTAVDRALKNQIVTSVEPVFLYSLVYQLTGFGQVSALTMLHHLFSNNGAINKINLKENTVKMMGPYDLAEPLSLIIEQLERGI